MKFNTTLRKEQDGETLILVTDVNETWCMMFLSLYTFATLWHMPVHDDTHALVCVKNLNECMEESERQRQGWIKSVFQLKILWEVGPRVQV